jgi:hypothetical protein
MNFKTRAAAQSQPHLAAVLKLREREAPVGVLPYVPGLLLSGTNFPMQLCLISAVAKTPS